MKSSFASVVSLLVVLSFGATISTKANAATIPAELITDSGDSLITLDTGSGLEWLDIPLTAGLTYSFVESSSWNLSGQGWRHATTSEITDLFVRNLSTNGSVPTSSYTTGNDLTATGLLIDLLGATWSIASIIEVSGMYDDGSQLDKVGVGGLEIQGIGADPRAIWRISPGQRTLFDSTDEGHFMVRVSAVPIPAAAWLFGSALLGLAGIGRKRKQAAKPSNNKLYQKILRTIV